jgi:hypothetical protein
LEPGFFHGSCPKLEKARFLFIAQVRPKLKSVPYFKYGLRISYQFRFLKRHSQKSLPASLFKRMRVLLNASAKRFRFFPLRSGGKPTPQGEEGGFIGFSFPNPQSVFRKESCLVSREIFVIMG